MRYLASLVFLSAFFFSFLPLMPCQSQENANAGNSDFEIVVQTGHSQAVTDLSFSPDGKLIASASWDGTVKLWNTRGKLLRTLKAHDRGTSGVVFSPNGRFFASSAFAGFAGGARELAVKLWKVDGTQIWSQQGHQGSINSIAFSPDGRFIASCSDDATVRFWSVDGKKQRVLKGHRGNVYDLSFSSDGGFLVSCGLDKTVKVWSLDGEIIHSFEADSIAVQCVAVNRDGLIATGGTENSIKLWNQRGESLGTVEGLDHGVRRLAFTHDGRHLLSIEDLSGSIKLWRIRKGSGVEVIVELAGELPQKRDFRQVFCMVLSRDSETLACGVGDLWNKNNSIRLVDMNGVLKRDIRGYGNQVKTVTFSPDGKYVIGGGWDNTVRMWSMNGNLVKSLRKHRETVMCLSYSADGQSLATRGQLSERITRVWDADGRLLREVEHDCFVTGANTVQLSPNGKLIACIKKDNNAALFDSTSGKEILTFVGKTKKANCFAFSPDGKHFAIGGWDNFIDIWTTEGELVASFKGPDEFTCIQFSPDGESLVTGSYWSNTAKLWNLYGKQIGDFISPRDHINYVAFSPDGSCVAGCGWEDSSVYLWTVEGRLLKVLKGHSDQVNCVAFSPDGKYLASASEDSTVALWDLQTGEHVTLLAFEDEWLNYTSDGYFDSSPNGGNLVAMVKEIDAYGIDQFAVRNNRPDILLKRLGSDNEPLIRHYHNQYRKRMKKFGLSEEDLTRELHVPDSEIVEIAEKGKVLEMTLRFSDSVYDLKLYNVYVNDVPVFGAYGKSINGRSLTKVESIELISGENKIEVSCLNEKGAESYRAIAYATFNETAERDLYFLGFGVSKYADSALDLRYSHQDVIDLAGVLQRMKSGFRNIHIQACLDEEVTPENIKKAKKMLANAKVDDVFVLFISGHGVHDTDEFATYYYLTHDTDLNNLRNTAADFELIEDLLQGVAPRSKLFLMDTCESGEVEEAIQDSYMDSADSKGIRPRTTRKLRGRKTEDGQRRSFLFQKDRFIYNDLARRSGAIVFSSSKGGEFSYEMDELGNGLFTEEILNAFTTRKADRDDSGVITTDELRAYVSEAVSKLSDDLQHPTVDRDNIYQKFGFPVVE